MLTDREAAEFKRGPLQMLVLLILKQADMFGLQIAQEIRARSGGSFNVTDTAFYVVLYRLADKGFISTTEGTGSKRKRVYYHLEPKGEEYLKELMDAYNMMSEGVERVMESCK